MDDVRATGRFIFETAILCILAFLLAQGIRTFLVQPFLIPTGSMIPTIELQDRVLANKLVYRIGGKPERGDVVVLDDPTGEYTQLIKRVVAVGGDVLDLRDGEVYLNGAVIDEPYTHGLPSYTLSQLITFPFEVPVDSVFVMGDNRTNSSDSRVFGAIPLSDVNGRAFWTYWPFARFGSLN